MRDLIAELTAIAGAAHVFADQDVVAGYATDWTRRYKGSARCVVRPGSAEEVAATIGACAARGVPVVPQGGNTGLVGGSVPPPETVARGTSQSPANSKAPVIVSLTRLDDLDPVDMVTGQVTAGAGVTIARVAAHAERAGLRYAVDLASRESATVGGTIATNAGGIHTIRYGPTRAQVVGVSAVLADGSVISDMSGLTAGRSGYDLAQLLTGSEGTLGVITRARLALRRPDPAAAVLLAGVSGIAEAAALYSGLRGEVPGLLAAEYMDGAGMELVITVSGLPAPLRPARPGYLLAEITGPPGSEQPVSDPLMLAAAGLPDETVLATDRPDRAALWAYRERLTETIAAVGMPHKVDVAVPAAELTAFRSELDEVVDAAVGAGNAQVIVFGHIGVGNLHVNILGPDHADMRVDAEVARLAAAHGGSVAAEHGIGRAKTAWLEWSVSETEITAMRAIKSALDPAGLLNPGVLLPPAGGQVGTPG